MTETLDTSAVFAAEAQARLARQTERISDLSAQVATLTANLTAADEGGATARNEAWQAKQALTDFRTLVRAVAIRVRGEQGWCLEGLNGVLAELGLPECVPNIEVEVMVRCVLRDVPVGDDADAAAAAREAISELEAQIDGLTFDINDNSIGVVAYPQTDSVLHRPQS